MDHYTIHLIIQFALHLFNYFVTNLFLHLFLFLQASRALQHLMRGLAETDEQMEVNTTHYCYCCYLILSSLYLSLTYTLSFSFSLFLSVFLTLSLSLSRTLLSSLSPTHTRTPFLSLTPTSLSPPHRMREELLSGKEETQLNPVQGKY